MFFYVTLCLACLHVLVSLCPGWMHVCEDFSAQQAGGNPGLLQARRDLPERRQAVSDVPGGGPAELPHRGGQHEGQAHQVQADSGG